MSEAVSFVVPGVPAPQGSKVRTKWGMREDNPATRPWRQAVAWEAKAAMNGRPPIAGPCELHVTFKFPRPKSHYRTGRHAGTLKASAPIWHATKPDTDKLLRAIGDALTGVVVMDDCQFARVLAETMYGEPCAVVNVYALDDARDPTGFENPLDNPPARPGPSTHFGCCLRPYELGHDEGCENWQAPVVLVAGGDE